MSSPKISPKICVVGASNIDLFSYAPRLPKLGETLTGTRFQMGFGGKGANQAVMAAKLGAEVAMITKLGDDIFGKDTLKNYETLGFDTRHVLFTKEASTGVAPIWVDGATGNNAIIVVPGANDLLTAEDVAGARAALGTMGLKRRRVAIEPAARDLLHLGQERSEATHGRRLARAAVAEDQDAADRRIDGGQHQGELHLVLSDNGGKWIGRAHQTCGLLMFPSAGMDRP